MSVSKKQRTAKEAVYEAINKDIKSVCSGQFYIKNRKVSETCKKCEKCAKYKLYKQKTDDNPEVTYLYVDSFRECELYKMELPKKEEPIQEKKEQPRIKTQSQSYSFKPFGSKSLINPLSSFALKCEAYNRMSENHGDLLAYITWSELFAIEIMMSVIDETCKYFVTSKLYKQEIKMSFNKFVAEFGKYKAVIRQQCYNKDEEAVIDFVKEVSQDVVIMRYSIWNFLNKLKVNNPEPKAYLLTTLEVMHEIIHLHNENEWNARQKEKNLQLSDFLIPKNLVSSMNDVILHITKKDSVGVTIDLNKDINITNGLNVIKNKIRNADRIANIIVNVYALTQNRQSNNDNK